MNSMLRMLFLSFPLPPSPLLTVDDSTAYQDTSYPTAESSTALHHQEGTGSTTYTTHHQEVHVYTVQYCNLFIVVEPRQGQHGPSKGSVWFGMGGSTWQFEWAVLLITG